MTDLFPALALGDVLDEANAITIKAVCKTAVAKGQLVKWDTHIGSDLGSISTAGAEAKNLAGGAMKTGAVGDVIPICKIGIWKAKASGVITLGDKIVSDANGLVGSSPALDAPASYTEAAMQTELDKIEARCGVAMQSFADSDEGLVFLNIR